MVVGDVWLREPVGFHSFISSLDELAENNVSGDDLLVTVRQLIAFTARSYFRLLAAYLLDVTKEALAETACLLVRWKLHKAEKLRRLLDDLFFLI